VAEERARKIEEMSLQTIQTLAYAIDAKDPYTKGHSTRVSQYSAIIAEKLGWSPDRISDLRYAALLHDIGKIGVPDSILNNPKKLTDVEYSIIKSHTTMGGDILRDRTMIRSAEDVARSHHERYDGRGYPAGLKGEEISAEARIVAIADAFDAMSSNRIYRKSCDPEYILRELEQGRGTQFDPEFTGVFLQLLKEGHLEEILQKDAPESAGSPESPSALLQEVVEAFAAQSAADAVDLITGVMSRSAGEGAIAKRMQQEAGCLAFVDMDNLKTINDTLGHESGDHALHLLGEILLSCVGEDGLCCRLGGDEFLLFLPGFTREAAEKRIRIIISRFNEKKGGKLRHRRRHSLRRPGHVFSIRYLPDGLQPGGQSPLPCEAERQKRLQFLQRGKRTGYHGCKPPGSGHPHRRPVQRRPERGIPAFYQAL
jgi:putative nucleotidyltransferase with HDIG domain